MATYSSILAWRIPGTGEPGGPLDCKEIQRVHSEGDQPWDFFGRNDAKAETILIFSASVRSIHFLSTIVPIFA